jgi:ketosteroid isomerase-like protein
MRSAAPTRTITAEERPLGPDAAARGLEPGLDLLSPDVELDLSELPDGTVLYGRAAVREYWERHADVWQEFEIEPEWVAEHDGVLVALVELRGRGRLSGAPVAAQAAWVADVRDGRLNSAFLTFNRGRALEAVST